MHPDVKWIRPDLPWASAQTSQALLIQIRCSLLDLESPRVTRWVEAQRLPGRKLSYRFAQLREVTNLAQNRACVGVSGQR